MTAFDQLRQQEQSAGAAEAQQPHGDGRFDDLAQIIEAYSAVTERLQSSHERLQGEVVRLRRELSSANEQVQRSRRLSALGEMAAGIAHEIRNPLAAIQLYAGHAAEDLQASSDTGSAAALETVGKIASAVRGMSAIVNDVLSFARGMEPTRIRVDATELLDRVLASAAPGIDEFGVHVVRQDLSSKPLVFLADAGLLQQALLNLVRNAVDAMAAVKGQRVLTVSASADEVGVQFAIADTGPGIPDECLDRIFNPFFTTRDAGTGLGLAIVHRIADAHGGSIAAHRDPRTGGAVFALSLPVSEPANSVQGDDAGRPDHKPMEAA